MSSVLQQSMRLARAASGAVMAIAKPSHSQKVDWGMTHEGQNTAQMEPSGARYEIEIRGTTLCLEANDLTQIGALLNGHSGRVWVYDRESHSLFIDGNVKDVRDALCALVPSNADSAWCQAEED